jgi:DNA-directed RNA polymerase subunit F
LAEELDVEVLEEKQLSNSEAYLILKKIVSKIQEKEESVPPLLMKTLNYLSKFTEKINPEAASSLRKTLEQYGLKPETIIMIMNICPQTLDELRILLVLEEKVIDTDTANEILGHVKTYCTSK